MCDASGSHQQKCASITQEPYTQTLPAHNDTFKLLSPSCDLVPGLNKYIEDLENFEKDARL